MEGDRYDEGVGRRAAVFREEVTERGRDASSATVLERMDGAGERIVAVPGRTVQSDGVGGVEARRHGEAVETARRRRDQG